MWGRRVGRTLPIGLEEASPVGMEVSRETWPRTGCWPAGSQWPAARLPGVARCGQARASTRGPRRAPAYRFRFGHADRARAAGSGSGRPPPLRPGWPRTCRRVELRHSGLRASARQTGCYGPHDADSGPRLCVRAGTCADPPTVQSWLSRPGGPRAVTASTVASSAVFVASSAVFHV